MAAHREVFSLLSEYLNLRAYQGMLGGRSRPMF
jgi:hypothetical protein